MGTGGAITINPGGTLRTLATGGANLGGGAITLTTGAVHRWATGRSIRQCDSSRALTFGGGNSTIFLDNAPGSTASLEFSSATTVTRSNDATLIINAATAFDGVNSDFLRIDGAVGGNAAAPTSDKRGSPGYILSTIAGSGSANLVTSVNGGANGTSVAGST